MEITGIRIRKLRQDSNVPPPESLVELFTDEDIVGNSMVESYYAEELLRRFSVEKNIIMADKRLELLMGGDPYQRERIELSWNEQHTWQLLNNGAMCALDECLWDIVGKSLKLPVYKLIGGYRDKILAYASTQHYETANEYLKLCDKLVEDGYKAIKLHPHRNAKRDIALCKAVRERVGDDTILLMDPFNAYSREEALEVGRTLDKLNFYWFEDPIATTDIDGLAGLCRSLDVEILMGENIHDVHGYTEYIRRGATDELRCLSANLGGITPMLKVAHLAETFGMKCEPHSWGNPLTQAAHLQLMLGISNCDFFELPVPEGIFDRGFKTTLRIDSDGYVHAPENPGLGIEIDEAEFKRISAGTATYPADLNLQSRP